MAEVSYILFVRGKKVTPDMLELARENNMVLLETDHSMYHTVGELYSAALLPIYSERRTTDMLFKFELEGGKFSKAGYASSQIKKVLKQLAIDHRIIKRVVVALYEAEVNIVAHAWRGTVVAELDADKISLELKDEGPGIPDISLAMREGYSTASEAVREMGFGAGMGLPNMKKNVDELTIESQVDVGTTVRMVTWFNKEGA